MPPPPAKNYQKEMGPWQGKSLYIPTLRSWVRPKHQVQHMSILMSEAWNELGQAQVLSWRLQIIGKKITSFASIKWFTKRWVLQVPSILPSCPHTLDSDRSRSMPPAPPQTPSVLLLHMLACPIPQQRYCPPMASGPRRDQHSPDYIGDPKNKAKQNKSTD